MLAFIAACSSGNSTETPKVNPLISQPITCIVEQEIADPENLENKDKIFEQTCSWGRYQSIKTGFPDYKGRYRYDYQLREMKNGKWTPIKNMEIFNERAGELEKKINEEIRNELKIYLDDPKSASCFSNFELMPYTINELGISFSDEKEIRFNVVFELSSACMNVDGTTINMKLEEVVEYLK
jgi:hypothetical protein